MSHRMAVEMTETETDTGELHTETTMPNLPHVVSLWAFDNDQPVQEKSPSPISTEVLDEKLRVAQSFLQQEDNNPNAGVSKRGRGAKVADIDQVRELLFGGYMRVSDRRFKGLEERFYQENLSFRDEMFDQIKALEERIDGEIDALSESTQLERQQRQSAIQNLKHELNVFKNELNNGIRQLDDKLSYELKCLRQLTHKKFQNLALQMRLQNDNLIHLVNKKMAQLHDEKVNRNDLGAFFNRFAMHLMRNYE